MRIKISLTVFLKTTAVMLTFLENHISLLCKHECFNSHIDKLIRNCAYFLIQNALKVINLLLIRIINQKYKPIAAVKD